MLDAPLKTSWWFKWWVWSDFYAEMCEVRGRWIAALAPAKTECRCPLSRLGTEGKNEKRMSGSVVGLIPSR